MNFFLLIPAIVCCAISTAYSQPQTFNYTGAVQNYTIPACVNSIIVDVKGAEGGISQGGSVGGKGGRVQATIPIAPGQILNIYVGQKPSLDTGGWNGGAAGGVDGGGGGGASDIRIGGTALSNRIVVAGGGGGGGTQLPTSTGYLGGHGGGLTGADGWSINIQGGAFPGKGGTQTEGGAGGTNGSLSGSAGDLGVGGSGAQTHGGGGGAGYYGGGGGAAYGNGGPGGGGGSGYTISTATGVTHNQGFQTGSGHILITPVKAGPAVPDTITGNATVYADSVGTYSITAVPTATTYTWTVPSGSTITSGQGTISITVKFGASSGNISVTAGNACGTSAPDTMAVTVATVSVKDELVKSLHLHLSQNYPNPFDQSTTITYELFNEEQVSLRVFDVMSRERAVIINNVLQSPGSHSVTFSGEKLESGFYYYKFDAGSASVARGMLVKR